MELFILRLMEMAYQVAGLERAELVKVMIATGTLAWRRTNWWVWLTRLFRRPWIVVGHTVYMTSKFYFVDTHGLGGLDLEYVRMLRHVRYHELYGTWGAWWRQLVWWPIKARLSRKGR